MLVEMLISPFYSLVIGFFNILPTIPKFSIQSGFLDSIFEFLKVAAWFLPMPTIVMILGILIAEEIFKICLSVLKMIWKFIPLIGA